MIYNNLNSLPIGKHNPNFERANFFMDDTESQFLKPDPRYFETANFFMNDTNK